MKKELEISQVRFYPVMELRPLMADADAEGFSFVNTLEENWRRGKHRFEQEGEALFVYREGRRIHGIAGVDRRSELGEEYARWITPFVRPDWRNRGIGKELALKVLDFASGYYRGVVASLPQDPSFCEKLGFLRKQDRYLLEFAAN